MAKPNHMKIAFYPTDKTREILQRKMKAAGATRTDVINDAIELYGEVTSAGDLASTIRMIVRDELRK